MKRFVEGLDRTQSTLFPERLEDWIGDDNPVRVIDVFVDELDLGCPCPYRKLNSYEGMMQTTQLGQWRYLAGSANWTFVRCAFSQ